MSKPKIDWSNLKATYDDGLLAKLKQLFTEAGPFTISAEELVYDTNCRAQDASFVDRFGSGSPR